MVATQICFIFTPKLGKDEPHFDEHIFQMGWFNHQLDIIEGSLNRNFRQYGELKSSSRVVKSVDRRCNSQKVRRKKIHPRQMLEKSRNAVFFHRFVCRVSPKVGLLKRRVRR